MGSSFLQEAKVIPTAKKSRNQVVFLFMLLCFTIQI